MRPLLVCISLLFVAACGRSNEGKPSMSMHRLQAGVPDADGWYLAVSTDGDFAVSFPVKFNDFTVRVKETDDRTVTTYGLGSKDEDGVVFSAAEIPIDSIKKKGREILESARAKGLVQEAHTRIFDIENGGRACEWLERNSERGSYFRVIDYPHAMIVLGITFPLSAITKVERCRGRFFDSLKIKRPNQSPEPTVMSVTPRADARVAPATTVAHL